MTETAGHLRQANWRALLTRVSCPGPAEFLFVVEAEDDPAVRTNQPVHLSIGRCYFQAPQVDAQTCLASIAHRSPGELVRCAIVASEGYDLVARPLEELEARTSLPILGG